MRKLSPRSHIFGKWQNQAWNTGLSNAKKSVPQPLSILPFPTLKDNTLMERKDGVIGDLEFLFKKLLSLHIPKESIHVKK